MVLLYSTRERKLEAFSTVISNNVGTTAKQQTPFGPQFHERVSPNFRSRGCRRHPYRFTKVRSLVRRISWLFPIVLFVILAARKVTARGYVSKVADTMRPSENANRLTATFPAPGGPGAFAIEISEIQIVRADGRRVVPGKATNHPSLSLRPSSLYSSIHRGQPRSDLKSDANEAGFSPS